MTGTPRRTQPRRWFAGAAIFGIALLGLCILWWKVTTTDQFAPPPPQEVTRGASSSYPPDRPLPHGDADSETSDTPEKLLSSLFPGRRRPPCQPVGLVTWEDGSPASGALIEQLALVEPDHGGIYLAWVDSGVVADHSGWYQLGHQDSCPSRLAAYIPGRGRGEEMAAPLPDGATVPYELRRDLVLQSAVGLRGRVLSPEGSVVADAVVCASPTWTVDPLDLFEPGEFDSETFQEAASRNWAYRDTTDDDGRFELPALDPGSWTIIVEPVRYAVSVFETMLTADAGNTEQDFTLDAASCWSVVVRDEHSMPIEGVRVSSHSKLGTCTSLVEEERTGPDGRVELCEVPRIDAWVHAEAPGFSPVSLTNEHGAPAVEIEMLATGAVMGRLVPFEPEHCPCTTFAAPGGGVGSELIVEDDGAFFVEGVPRGDHRSSFHTKWGSWLPEERYHVEPGEVTDLGTIELTAAPRVDTRAISLPMWSPLLP